MQVNCNLSDHVKAITVPPSLEAQETIYGVIRRGRRCNRALSPPDISRGHGPRDGNNDSHPQGSSRQRKDRIPRSHPRRGVASPSFLSEKGRCESFVHIRDGLPCVLRSHPRRVVASPSFPSRASKTKFLRLHPKRVGVSPSFPLETRRRESFLPIPDGLLRVLRSYPDVSLRVFVPIRDGLLQVLPSHPRRDAASPSFMSETCHFVPIQDGLLRVLPSHPRQVAASLRSHPRRVAANASFVHIRDGKPRVLHSHPRRVVAKGVSFHQLFQNSME